MKNRFALVTGGAGFIGSHLVDRLVSDGWRVRIMDNFSSGRIENIEDHGDDRSIEILNGDLKNLGDANNSVEDVDVVFHYAANPEVRVSTINPEVHFNENLVATFNLLEAMRKNNAKEIVFASSSSVYGELGEIPADESAPIRPVSVYGASKASCENLIHAYSRLYGVKSILLRYANVIGPRLRHGVVYDLYMKLQKNRRELEVLGDGTQTRSYIYIEDAVEATMTAYSKTASNFEVYNVASEDLITVKDVVKAVLEELNLKDVKITYKPVLHGVGWLGDVKKITLDIGKLRMLGFDSKRKSIEAVKNTLERFEFKTCDRA